MREIEKTCENCEYENEDMEGTHCRHCIHNAEECFEPKIMKMSENEIRAKAIDEFADRLKKKYENCVVNDILMNNDVMSYTNSCNVFESFIDEIAEEMRGAV